MNKYKIITIIGLGVIGGSIARAIRYRTTGISIIGVDSEETLIAAKEEGVIEQGLPPEDLAEAVSEADLIFICTPINEILKLLPEISKAVKPGALVTDVGSTKVKITEMAKNYFYEEKYFIGAHPMTGREDHSFAASEALLFENAFYVLTPPADIPKKILSRYAELLEVIGAKILLLSPQLHDRIVAKVSHLPQLLAVILMNLANDSSTESANYLKLAAGGFRDMTRIASSSWKIWHDIIQTNRNEIVNSLQIFIEQAQKMIVKLQNGNLDNDFSQAARTRISIPADMRGFLNPNFDLNLWLEDKPGVIAKISSTLANEEINIKDIEILKVREGEAGTLRISFASQKIMHRAAVMLKKNGFRLTTV